MPAELTQHATCSCTKIRPRTKFALHSPAQSTTSRKKGEEKTESVFKSILLGALR
jgi:hypothetical protein